MKRRKIALFLWALVVVFVAVVAFSKPIVEEALRRLLVGELGRRMNAQVSLGELRVSLFPPEVELGGIEIKKTQGPLRYIGVRQVTIRPGTAPVFFGHVTIKNVRIEEPSLRLDLSAAGPLKPKPKTVFRIPSLRDLIRVTIDEANVVNARLVLTLPDGETRLLVNSGYAGFKGAG